jgi:transcriptional regulator with XRE-family HTH domain
VNQPQSLSELVELAAQYRDASGLGLSQLAAKNGYQLTATTINQIRQGLYKSKPREGTLRALAWLAGVSDEVAFTAAGQTVPGPPFAEELPPGVDNLSPKARKVVLDMVRVLVDLEKSANASNTDAEEQPTDIRDARERRNTRAGQKTSPGSESETVVPLSDDAIDRLHKEQWESLAAKKAPGGITHDQNPEDT